MIAGGFIAILTAAVARAQGDGDITGRVRESWGRGVGILGARIEVSGTGLWAVTDYKGRFRLHGVSSGTRKLTVTAAGYSALTVDAVPVYPGTETRQDIFLSREGSPAAGPVPSAIVDPLGIGLARRFSREDLAELPLTTVQEGADLWTGISGEDYRAGRPGSQLLTIDAIPVRNIYDGSTTPIGLRVSPVITRETWLDVDHPLRGSVPALAGYQGVSTLDAERRWNASVGYHTDRPASSSADFGLDRFMIEGGGPVGSGAFLAVLDMAGQQQVSPHHSPAGDPQTPLPWELPHNSGERYDGAAVMRLPLGSAHTLNLLGVYSGSRLLMFDPGFKYAPQAGSAQGIDAALVAAELRTSSHATTRSLRLDYFSRTATVSELTEAVNPVVGALGGSYQFRGLPIAEAQDTAAAHAVVPGFAVPTFSTQTPWGVPAFFMNGGSRGTLLWNQYREARLDFGWTQAPSRMTTLTADVGAALGEAKAFQRVLASLPVGDSVPPATAAEFHPIALSANGSVATRILFSQVTGGVRIDAYAPRPANGGNSFDVAVNPALEAVIPLHGITFTGGLIWSSQFPDLQYLAPIAFDDSLAGGRFRRGNPDLHHERALAKQVAAALWPWQRLAVRVTGFSTHFTDLVQSHAAGVADSALVSNSGDLQVTGVDLQLTERFSSSTTIAAAYTYETADYGAPDGFRLSNGSGTAHDVVNLLVVTGTTILPAAIETGGSIRLSSGPPFSGVASSARSMQAVVDLRLRRRIPVGDRWGIVYLDVRNLLNQQTVIAWQRSTGTAALSAAAVDSLAQAAYAAHPDPIPYESPRYRASADTDGNGVVEGAELMASYQAAAEDFAQPLLAYGAPRTIRIGVELAF